MKAQIVGELLLEVQETACCRLCLAGAPADKERAFFAIFSTMIGATALSRILPAQARARVLASARDFLLRSFDHP